MLIGGIDEAGYGPMLGPLCVAMTAVRVQGWDSERTPDLWSLLETGVCRKPGRGGASDAAGRVAVADSKQIKLSNSVTTTHPLVHLERGVLAFLSHHDGTPPASDHALFERLGTTPPTHAAYAGGATLLPVALDAASIGIAANILGRALNRANITLADACCACVPEARFNAIVRETQNKGETTAGAIGEHLRRFVGLVEPGERAGLVCDRLGGRAAYAGLLRRELGVDEVEVIEESATRSRYLVHHPKGRLGIAFLTEGESAHLPVALASMIAKYVRELAMLRFNAFWGERAAGARIELKPTAGYASDAKRWLHEAAAILTPDDRLALVRIA